MSLEQTATEHEERLNKHGQLLADMFELLQGMNTPPKKRWRYLEKRKRAESV